VGAARRGRCRPSRRWERIAPVAAPGTRSMAARTRSRPFPRRPAQTPPRRGRAGRPRGGRARCCRETAGDRGSAAPPLDAADLLVRRKLLRHRTGIEFAGLEDAREAVRLSAEHPDSPASVVRRRDPAWAPGPGSSRGLAAGRPGLGRRGTALGRGICPLAGRRGLRSRKVHNLRRRHCPVSRPANARLLAYVAAGRTYAEIARELVLSEKTVSVHVSHLLDKTSTTNRVELAQLARRVQK
jgi:DNA-binding CsgD family transcriptional regulator